MAGLGSVSADVAMRANGVRGSDGTVRSSHDPFRPVRDGMDTATAPQRPTQALGPTAVQIYAVLRERRQSRRVPRTPKARTPEV